MSSSYPWWTTPQNVRLPSLLCIFLGKMGKSTTADNAQSKFTKLVSGTWSKEPLPSWGGTVPWWTSQWTSAELLHTNLINLHGWSGKEPWNKKVPSLKNYSEIYICFCLFSFSLSFTSQSFLCLFRCAWSMQVVVPWNETNKRKNYAKHELWLMIAQSHGKCFHSLYLLTISIFGTVQFICQKYIYTCFPAEFCLRKMQWIS